MHSDSLQFHSVVFLRVSEAAPFSQMDPSLVRGAALDASAKVRAVFLREDVQVRAGWTLA